MNNRWAWVMVLLAASAVGAEGPKRFTVAKGGTLSLDAGDTGAFANFITRSGNKLMNGTKEFRFVGANMPGLVLPYDYTLGLTNRMRLPTAWEQEDAFQTLDRMNLRVVRTWNLPMRASTAATQSWNYVVGPGQFREEAFQTVDRLLALANRYRVRVLFDFTADSGDYLGGVGTYAAYRGKSRSAFYTDAQLKEDYKATVRYVLNRTNTVTGTVYKDDRAVLAWQFGNEMAAAPVAWLSEMAAFIKSVDPNHLVAETRQLSGTAQLIDPNIDLLTRHYYGGFDWAAACRSEISAIAGQRPFFVGEFGPYVDGGYFTEANTPGRVKTFLDGCIGMSGMAGALLWSMYFHREEGGFTWHQIFTYPNVWAYHWPGFASASAQAEIGILNELRAAAYRIQGQSVPSASAPDTPELLPFDGTPMFSWRGSAGAEGYDVERSSDTNAPWTVIASNLSDADCAYRPLFSDVTAKAGDVWYYRITARNAGGASPPSNVVGPVTVTEACLADDLQDFTRVSAKSAGLTVDNTYNALYAEYLFRAKGNTNDWLSYAVAGPVSEVRVTAFFTTGLVADPDFLFSADGTSFETVLPSSRAEVALPATPGGASGSARRTQADYVLTPEVGCRHFKLVWSVPMWLDRVEIRHSGK